MKTTQNAPMFDKAIRILRERYPEVGIMDICPEVDDNETFYYVASIYDHDAPNSIRKITGIITLNAETLESEIYDMKNIPEWVDRAIFEEYINVYGTYKLGRKNAVMGKKGLEKQTDGMEVVYINGTCYYYSGWTSIRIVEQVTVLL